MKIYKIWHYRKIKLLKEGINRQDAAQFMVGDLCLLMGNPEKVNLMYEWVEHSPMPDILEMGSMTNMLRRLLHVASAEYSELRRPHQEVQALLDEANAAATPKTVSTGVQVNTILNTNTKSPRGASPSVTGGGGRRINPTTPKNSGRTVREPTTPTTPKSHITIPLKPQTSSPVTSASAFISHIISPTSKPQMPHITIAPSPHTASVLSGAGGDAVFKMPAAVPVRPQIRPIAPNPYQATDFNPVSCTMLMLAKCLIEVVDKLTNVKYMSLSKSSSSIIYSHKST